ncbi:MAG: hypothetical protein V4501_00025 [Pseudomonadota bacterium]
MQRAQSELKDEVRRLAERNAAAQAELRSAINTKLALPNLDWEQYQTSLKSVKTLFSQTRTLDDLKLWHSIFKKAVDFSGNANTNQLFAEWRLILAAHEAAMNASSDALEEDPKNENLFRLYEAAVEYKKELIYKEFVKDSSRDGAYSIILEQNEKSLKALRKERSSAKWRAWCCWSVKPPKEESFPLAEEESHYVSLKLSNKPII